MSPPNIKVPGVGSIPSGYFLGRFDGGLGDVQLIDALTAGAKIAQAQSGQSSSSGSTALTDGQLLIGDTGAAAVAASLTAGSNITITPGAGSITIAATGGAGGTGLYGQVMSATPTAATTGLSTWLNQGSATTGDGLTGMWISLPAGAGANRASRYKAVPATPYTVTALITITSGGGDGTNNPIVGLGWTDGTKLHEIQMVYVGSGAPLIQVAKCTTSTATQTTDSSVQKSAFIVPVFFKIGDDGTNVSFSYSYDGVNYLAFTIAKSAGHLGASGYTNIAFTIGGANNNDAIVKAGTILSWVQA